MYSRPGYCSGPEWSCTVRRGELEDVLRHRNRPAILAILSIIVCALGDAHAADRLIEPFLPYEEQHVASAGGTAYFGPVSHWLGALQLKAGNVDQARRYLELAVNESARWERGCESRRRSP